jgi:hypothetical protein
MDGPLREPPDRVQRPEAGAGRQREQVRRRAGLQALQQVVAIGACSPYLEATCSIRPCQTCFTVSPYST